MNAKPILNLTEFGKRSVQDRRDKGSYNEYGDQDAFYKPRYLPPQKFATDDQLNLNSGRDQKESAKMSSALIIALNKLSARLALLSGLW